MNFCSACQVDHGPAWSDDTVLALHRYYAPLVWRYGLIHVLARAEQGWLVRVLHARVLKETK
jgi:hypothetical protein